LLTQFLVVMLDTEATLALPAIERDLGFSAGNLQWVQTAYMIGFGGFLLLAGRAADVFGRRRLLVLGLTTFTLSSALAGAAPSSEVLVAARAAQGLASALASAAALSIITVTFVRSEERDAALGAWGLVSGSGATVGFLVGGLVADLASWRWVFFILIPFGAFAAIASLLMVPAHGPTDRDQPLDLLGAVTSTVGLVALVFGVSESGTEGWASAATISGLVVGVVLLACFVACEARAASPLLPLHVLRLRNLVGGNVATLVFGAILLGIFALLSIYLQEGRGYSPIECGLALLPTGAASLLLSVRAGRLAGRYGKRRVLLSGMALLSAGSAALALATHDSSYLLGLLPASALFGIGICGTEVGSVITSVHDLGHTDAAGLASGLWSSSLQVGGALGLAVLATVMAASGRGAVGVTEGFRSAAFVAAGIGVVGVVVVWLILRGSGEPEA
jgi:EmrB/QacA subfamily drug resistance transporter